ncbi:PfkB family carbohydrate kinase [Persicobacter sp. CCB-QB2]|uniref:PfkB family carbohydrate kinase n=1 Tax=Persicobacter sp. CCB-QB2 TaxID=1561025 RepID=UPI0006A9E241|nr:PfkB family carbohydrate kinase [Persicobacter sp. CCB-QB2]
MSLLSIGTVAFDAIETPFGKTDKIVGGSCTYIALAASYFIKEANNIVAVVGDDFGNDNIADLNRHGIDTEGLQIKDGEKSFFWAGRYHNDMNSRDTLTTELNVLENFDPVIPESYQDCQYLMLGNLTPAIQIETIKRLKNRPKFIAMDTMNLWMDIAMDDLKKALTMIDMLIINDEEARQLSGDYSLVRAAQKIQEMGPKYLVIKKGEHGALLFGEGRTFFAPALPLEEVFDPTGAGDTFAGGLMGYLAKSDNVTFDNLKRGIIFGSAMASFTVEKFGPERLKDLDEATVNARVQEFVNLSQFEL